MIVHIPILHWIFSRSFLRAGMREVPLKRLFLCLLLLAIAGPSLAKTNPAALRTSMTYIPVYQFETDIASGGSFAVDRHLLRLDLLKPLSQQTQVGLGVHFDYEHWDFQNVTGLNGATPWSEVYRPTLSFNLFHAPTENWRMLFIPSVGLSTTDMSNAGDSLVYGAVVSVMRQFGPNLSLGFGVGAFDQLEKTTAFPFLAVKWKITDQWRLQNPLSAGPAGPAGLELVYRQGQTWEIGVGGAYRSYRFRLSDDNRVADGIGEVDFLAGFARISHTFNGQKSIDLSVGGLFSGNITTEDKGGNSLGETGYDTAPFIGLTFKGRF